MNLAFYSPITSLLQQILLRYTKFSLQTTLTFDATFSKPSTIPQQLDTQVSQTLGN